MAKKFDAKPTAPLCSKLSVLVDKITLDHVIIDRATPERQKDSTSLRELGSFYS